MNIFVWCAAVGIASFGLHAAYDISRFDVDFHTSMGKDHQYYAHYYTKGIASIEAQALLGNLQNWYEKNKFTALAPGALFYPQKTQDFVPGSPQPRHTCRVWGSLKIPKIIHQVWLGSPLPERFANYARTWKKFHPDWEYILWTDADIAQLHLENQDCYDKAINYAERSDIARYEILYRFGGLYVDTDFECLQPCDILHYYYDFYTGLELPAMALFLQPIIIPNGLIGSIPGHPILRTCIDRIKKNNSKTDNIVIKTGPLLFTQAVLEVGNSGDFKDIVMPATFFYPIDKNVTDRSEVKKYIRPETFAVHHWAGSWILKEEAFVPGIKIRSQVTGNIIKFTIVDERKNLSN